MKAAWSLLVLGVAFAAAPSAMAAPINGSAIKAAAEQIDIGESVHCRAWRHWHRWGYGRGCRGGITIYQGPSYRYRYGYRSHDGYAVRPRAGVTIRSEGFRGGGSVQGSTTFRGGGPAGGPSPRTFSAPSGGGGGGGGAMSTAPTGGGGPAMRGHGGGGGGGQGQGKGHGKGGGGDKQ